MSSFDPPPQFAPPFGGLGWPWGVENGTNRNLVPTFLFDFYTHYRPILHRLVTIHNAADDRQTERSEKAANAIVLDNFQRTIEMFVVPGYSVADATSNESHIQAERCGVSARPTIWWASYFLKGTLWELGAKLFPSGRNTIEIRNNKTRSSPQW